MPMGGPCLLPRIDEELPRPLEPLDVGELLLQHADAEDELVPIVHPAEPPLIKKIVIACSYGLHSHGLCRYARSI